jgi:hypothetical protein
MAKILLLIIVSLCLSGCANTPGEPGFNLGSLEMGPRTELQLRLEKPSSEAISNNEKMTVDMEHTNSGRNLDPSGLGVKGIWRF